MDMEQAAETHDVERGSCDAASAPIRTRSTRSEAAAAAAAAVVPTGPQRPCSPPHSSATEKEDTSIKVDAAVHPAPVHAKDEEALPTNNMWLVMPALGLMVFLSALDQTIIGTALPTIAAELGATPSEYSWVGTSYLLSQTIVTPVTGRITDIIGRKPAIYASISCLLVFSILCGAAKSIEWLIVARAFAGLGGGAIVGLTVIVISDIVPLSKIGAYQGNIGLAHAVASVMGPILGGVLTDRASWRWCFYINVPCCALALPCLFFTLKLNPVKGMTWADFLRTFDFVGLLLVMAGAALAIVGFSTAADSGFGVPTAYALIASGAVVLGLAVGHCLVTKRTAVIPKALLRTRTPMFFVLGSFLQSLMLVSAGFLLPQFFQGVRGSSPLSAGIQLLPFAVGTALFSVVGGQMTARMQTVRPIIWAGYALAGLGYILIYATYTPTASVATQEGVQVLAAAGVGMSVSAPIMIIQAATPFADRAACTAFWTLMRSLGATTGLAVLTAIQSDGVRRRFEQIDGYGTVFQLPRGSAGYHALHAIQDAETRRRVLDAFAKSIRICFLAGSAFLFAALLLTLCTKSYPLSRVQPPPTVSTVGDPEVTEAAAARESREAERRAVEEKV